MMAALPKLTLLLGPQTRTALALNTTARLHRLELGKSGFRALPSRTATPALRKNLDPAKPAADRTRDFDAQAGAGPTFFSAVNFFGPPANCFGEGRLFPEAAPFLAGLGDLAAAARLVVAPDTLPALFLAAGSAPLSARVRETPWEELYELSWADLFQAVRAAMPRSEILVLTPNGAAVRSAEVLGLLFGPAGSVMNPYALLDEAINVTGKAVLARMTAIGTPELSTLDELYDAFAVRPEPAELQAELGVEKITGALLDQRFDEDLDRIRALPGVTVI